MSNKDIPLNERIIFALDFASPDEAMDWVRKLEGDLKFFKVGLQLFLAGGFPMVDEIIKRGNKVMLDLKFYDIPETVFLAVEQLKSRGVTFTTVHGRDPIVAAAMREKSDLKILAVTVLTSFGENDLTGPGMSVEDLVLHRAKRAFELGCDGVVASALEAAKLRHELGNDFLIITPGIRPESNDDDTGDDQRRVATARQAFVSGADYVVIGRPIKNADDPVALVHSLQAEIAEGLAKA